MGQNRCGVWAKEWIAVTENKLLVLTVSAVILGAILGFTVRLANPSDTAVLLISFPGEILMRMLKLVILPMIITSLISSLVQLDTHTSGTVGLLTLAYYVCTTTLAVTLATVLVLTIRPGYHYDGFVVENSTTTSRDTSRDTVLDLVRHVFPENLFRATMQQMSTKYVPVKVNNETIYSRELVYEDNPNVLGVVAFCVAFGFIAGKLGSQVQAVKDLFIGLENIIMRLLMAMLWYSPIGILSLVAGNILEVKNSEAMLAALGMFIICSLVGLMLHFFVVLPLLYFLLTRMNPYKFLWHQLPAWFNVLGPSSSSAAMPITCHCLEEGNKIDPRVSRFVIPVGATINIDGAALYEAMATVFIAQLHRMPLTIGKAVAILITVTLSSVGSSSLPGAGLVSVLPVLAPIPVTDSDVAMLIAVDWFIDRIRTCNNVLGDSFGAGVVNYLTRNQRHDKNFSAEAPAGIENGALDVHSEETDHANTKL